MSLNVYYSQHSIEIFMVTFVKSVMINICHVEQWSIGAVA